MKSRDITVNQLTLKEFFAPKHLKFGEPRVSLEINHLLTLSIPYTTLNLSLKHLEGIVQCLLLSQNPIFLHLLNVIVVMHKAISTMSVIQILD